MITTFRRIYEKVSEESGLEQDFVYSVGDSVTRELRELLENPNSLAYELKGLGVFILRQKRLMRDRDSFIRFLEREKRGGRTELLNWENLNKKLELLDRLNEKIQVFKADKKEKRALRKQVTNGKQKETNEQGEDIA